MVGAPFWLRCAHSNPGDHWTCLRLQCSQRAPSRHPLQALLSVTRIRHSPSCRQAPPPVQASGNVTCVYDQIDHGLLHINRLYMWYIPIQERVGLGWGLFWLGTHGTGCPFIRVCLTLNMTLNHIFGLQQGSHTNMEGTSRRGGLRSGIWTNNPGGVRLQCYRLSYCITNSAVTFIYFGGADLCGMKFKVYNSGWDIVPSIHTCMSCVWSKGADPKNYRCKAGNNQGRGTRGVPVEQNDGWLGGGCKTLYLHVGTTESISGAVWHAFLWGVLFGWS